MEGVSEDKKKECWGQDWWRWMLEIIDDLMIYWVSPAALAIPRAIGAKLEMVLTYQNSILKARTWLYDLGELILSLD